MEECKKHSGMESDIKTLQKDTTEQWTAINLLRNRLPLWATIVISLLTFLLGISVKYGAIVGAVARGTE